MFKKMFLLIITLCPLNAFTCPMCAVVANNCHENMKYIDEEIKYHDDHISQFYKDHANISREYQNYLIQIGRYSAYQETYFILQ